MDVPDNANEHCPGATSESAGKSSACAGCPNQNICSSGAANQIDPGIELVRARLAAVKHKILIFSGKGGVGKSTITSLLARCLAGNDSDKNVAICDVDICGPSMPRVMGAQNEQVHQSGSGWSPVYVEENLSVMSIGFLLSSLDDAVIWRGPKKNAMIRQFLSEVDWGMLDYLLIDSPPGTSDEHLSTASYLSKADLSGAIIVTTPQEVSLLDVRKEINFCHKISIPVIGVIENMASFVCPNCTVQSVIFKATTGGAEQMCNEMKVPFLGSVPLDPRIGKSCDDGVNFLHAFSDSAAGKTVISIVKKIEDYLQRNELQTKV